MKLHHRASPLIIAATGLTLAACSGRTPSTTPPPAATTDAIAAAVATATITPTSAPSTVRPRGKTSSMTFTPPPDSAIPDTPFGAMVRKGRAIFMHTQTNARQYVGNDLNCTSCHLDAGRRAGSAPLWAAWGKYPAYRNKNHKVNTFADRLRGCFKFSMNGTAPPVNSQVIVALEAYSWWLATGAPIGKTLAGAGFPKLAEPAQAPSYARGQSVFKTHCALCHGADGQGQMAAGVHVFPPLWGSGSFNWGAGMHKVNTAAAFIKANMPFSRGDTLTDQQAWDVALYMDSHERPQDPRFTGSVTTTRQKYHHSQWSLYGTVVNGHLLGSAPAARQGTHQAPGR